MVGLIDNLDGLLLLAMDNYHVDATDIEVVFHTSVMEAEFASIIVVNIKGWFY